MSHSPLLLQLTVILGCARLLGMLLRRLGQPPVLGEMIAGFALGPAVLGALAPRWQAALFQPDNIAGLNSLSQLGLVLFMFVVGVDLKLPEGRGALRAAATVGGVSVLLPLLLGVAVAAPLFGKLAPAGVAFVPFALFVGVALSVSAFPIMARILRERGGSHTVLGRLSLSGAAVADLLSWVLLVLVVVVAGSGDWLQLVRLLGGVVALALLLFGGLRPLLARSLTRHTGALAGSTWLPGLLVGALACGYAGSLVGAHPVFGAFLFGACLPRDDRLLRPVVERVEHVAVLLLMPVFFALAGLNTTTEAFVGAGLGMLLLVLGVAVGGKLLGGALGARMTGMDWRQSWAVGSLMNARGLMELIVMKVGLDVGLIDRSMFTVLLVMAVVTTLMTGPLLTWLQPAPSAASVAGRG